MKRTLLFLFCIALLSAASAQDTIAGWTFPGSQLTPNLGLAINSSRFIGTEDDATHPVYFTNGIGSGDTAATAIGWNNGVMTKYWTVKFKTTGYENIKISSKQRAGSQNGGGPKEFLIQWRKGSSAAWANIIDDTIRVANDWDAGVVVAAALPSGADTASSSVSVRWVIATDMNTSGTAIDTLATSKIDDIIVTGTSISTGLTEVLYTANEINIYPNPSTGIINIVSSDVVESIKVYNQLGSLVFEQNNASANTSIDMSQFGKGIYFINLRNHQGVSKNHKVVIF